MAQSLTATLARVATLAAAAALANAGTAQAQGQAEFLSITGRILDGTGGAPIENGRILVKDGVVACVGALPACPPPPGARRLDAGGGSVIPGLIDLHSHPRPHYYGWFLASGVTTVRSANTSLEMARALDALPAPRAELVWAGPLVDGEKSILKRFYPAGEDGAPSPARPADGPSLEGIELLVAQTPEQAVAAIDALVAGGAHWVKLYEQLPPEAYAAAANRAREKGLPIMADLGMASTRGLGPAEVDLLQAAAMGLDTLEHASGGALAYQRLGGDLSAETLDPVLVDRLARALLEANIALVPTLSVFHFNGSEETPEAGLKGVPFADAGGAVHDDLMQHWAGVRQHHHGNPVNLEKARLDTRIGMAVARRLVELGGRVGAGSDTPAGSYTLPGGGVHLEMELLTRAGLTPLQALSAATGTAADILQRDDIGRIEAGRRADLVIVEGDPSRDIRDTRRLRQVIRAGEVLDPTVLRDETLVDGDARLAALMAANPE
ncbi:hypothetical protein D8I30_08170 [Brevundimonas naejangsanensis]|uniref:Amidohydrolase-related domain-containing protein n=1 Tax=Brevundimonas naejangsanensis TaxID=588932 RepID=A0A494RIC3_9CAUL|nr:amidohydrolase family protein [Brevundimonas naejangsanensis]AYG95159.1 hypothetical protein D8I30_08170 [Brevundimonas naejangsanensis]